MRSPIIRKRLLLEPLEDRRMMAVFIADIPEIRINEGDEARVSAAKFYDSTPGGSYTASVNWGEGGGPVNASVAAPDGDPGPVFVTFDYRFDTSNFFNAERRAVLETAGEIAVGRLGDSLSGFTSSGSNVYNANLRHPGTGNEVTVPNFSVRANELIVFAGARNLAGNNLGLGGPGGGSANQQFFQIASTRGQLGAPATDFGPWGGGLTFDSATNWNFDISDTANPARGQNDFLSVAVHEIFHVLGAATGIESYERHVSGGRFTGPKATAAYDESGSPPLDSDNVHLREGTTDNGNEAVLDPTITTGSRKLPTELDFALLDDLGWDIRSRFRDGIITAGNDFNDNGVFNPTITVRNGNESQTTSFRVVVSNVAPSFGNLNNVTGRAGQSINISAAFTDPGTDDTFSTLIDWGDGSQQETPSPNGNRINASHVYANPGQYTIQVGVQDDDGGQDIQSFTANVTAPPRGDWQNPANQYDVNGTQSVEPLDALLVINELTTRTFSNPSTGALPRINSAPAQFLDVNGDDFVAPADALLVINQLGSSSAALSSSTDQAFMDLDQNEEELDESQSGNSVWASIQTWL